MLVSLAVTMRSLLMAFVVRPELTCYIGPCLSADSYASRRRTAAGVQDTLRKCTRSGVSGQIADGRALFPVSRVVRYNSARQRMSEPGAEAGLRGSMIVQILMQASGHGMTDACADGMRGESCPDPLSESSYATAIVFRMSGHLPNCGAADYATHGPFAEGRMLPMLPVGV